MSSHILIVAGGASADQHGAVLVKTLYMDAALQQLRKEGFPPPPEDVARLSPLIFDHINLLGRYAFSVPDSVKRGELRPLRNPEESLEEVM